MNSKEFSLIIEKFAIEKKPITYIDAIVLYCEENNLEVESASKLLTKNLKEKIAHQAREANLLKEKRSGTLPI
tara:strand:+ start:86 stop:304 length:219 start_codon:yes stop_codon:yes gene_type:complete